MSRSLLYLLTAKKRSFQFLSENLLYVFLECTSNMGSSLYRIAEVESCQDSARDIRKIPSQSLHCIYVHRRYEEYS